MKRIIKLILFLLLIIPTSTLALSKNYNDYVGKYYNIKNDEKVNIYLFYSKICPHCQKEEKYFETLKEKYQDKINIYTYEVTENKTNNEIMKSLKKELKENNQGVPFTIIGSKTFLGYDESFNERIENTIDSYLNENTTTDNIYTIPILGKVEAKNASIILIAIILGFIDGFNPCAMWILIFLITMLFNMKDRKKMWILGLTFILTSGIVYLMFMLAWLNLATFISKIAFIRLLIAVVALVVGLINIYKYIDSLKKKDEGCDVVDKKDRKKIMEKIISITHEKKFIIALLGVMVLAASVNIIELMCSIGIPLLFTQILAMNNLSTFSYMIYMFIYIFFFLIDDIVIFIISMVTLKVTGLSTKYTKYSHLIGGIIMLIIGLLLIIKPELLMFNF